MFCGIVSRAMTLEVLSTGVAGYYNGALQVVLISSSIKKNSKLCIQANNFFMHETLVVEDRN